MDCLEAWYTALHSPNGAKFATEDVEKAKQQLYRIRKEINDPQLAVLFLTTSPTNPNHIWIVHEKKAGPRQGDIELDTLDI